MSKFLLIILLWISSNCAAPNLGFQKTLSKPLNPRIVNGEAAKLGQFPWEVFVILASPFDLWSCGGAIISKDWILTAGHCVERATSASVQTGMVNVSDPSAKTQDVHTFILHENYNSTTLANDIGLIKLNESLQFDDNTQAITLSTESLDSNVGITISGYGQTGSYEPISLTLQYINLTTISNEECAKIYGNINPEVICAKTLTDEVKTICMGDSGGAVTKTDTEPKHFAIASFGSWNDCEEGDPTGYVQTAVYRDWIKEKTGI